MAILASIATFFGISRSWLIIGGLVLLGLVAGYLGFKVYVSTKVAEGIRRQRAKINERIIDDVDRIARSDDALRSNPDRAEWLRKKYQRD